MIVTGPLPSFSSFSKPFSKWLSKTGQSAAKNFNIFWRLSRYLKSQILSIEQRPYQNLLGMKTIEFLAKNNVNIKALIFSHNRGSGGRCLLGWLAWNVRTLLAFEFSWFFPHSSKMAAVAPGFTSSHLF